MIYLLLFPLILFAVPTFHWLDSAELACAACSLGVGHPPGQVPHAVFGHILSFLPIGDCGFRVTLLSLGSVFGAFVFIYLFIKEKLNRKFTIVETFLFYAVILSPIVVLQTKRPEVYGLSFLLFAATLWFSEQKGDVRHHYVSIVIWILGMINHPVIGLSATPFVFRRGHLVKYFIGFPVLLLLVYLSLRSNSLSQWDFGHPNSFSQLQWFLEGKLYKAYDHVTFSQIFMNLQNILILFLENGNPFVCILALAGGLFLYREDRNLTLRLATSFGFSIIPLMIMTNFSSTNPDVGGYLLPSFGLLLTCATWGWLGVHRLVKERKIYTFFISGVLLSHITFVDLNQEGRPDWSPLVQLRLLSSEPTAHASIQISSFHTFSFLRYGQIIEGVRPDLDLIYRGLRSQPTQKVIFKGPQDEFWELAIDRNQNGFYSLRKEDRLRANLFKQTGWFQRLGFQGDAIDVQTYTQNLNKTIQSYPFLDGAFLEPLLLNQLNQISLSVLLHDSVRSHELVTSVHRTFPKFNEFGSLEGMK